MFDGKILLILICTSQFCLSMPDLLAVTNTLPFSRALYPGETDWLYIAQPFSKLNFISLSSSFSLVFLQILYE